MELRKEASENEAETHGAAITSGCGTWASDTGDSGPDPNHYNGADYGSHVAGVPRCYIRDGSPLPYRKKSPVTSGILGTSEVFK